MFLWRDLRIVLRHLGRSPAYSLSVVVTLALAIGANSAIFSAVHAVLLRPLPLADAGRTGCRLADRQHHR